MVLWATHSGKGRDLFNPFFIVRDLVPWRALLSEPKHPPKAKLSDIDIIEIICATYVLRRGWAEGEDAPPERVAAIGPPASFSPSAMSDVAKSFEDWRTGFGALVIVAVVVLDAGFARNRDCDGALEK